MRYYGTVQIINPPIFKIVLKLDQLILQIYFTIKFLRIGFLISTAKKLFLVGFTRSKFPSLYCHIGQLGSVFGCKLIIEAIGTVFIIINRLAADKTSLKLLFGLYNNFQCFIKSFIFVILDFSLLLHIKLSLFQLQLSLLLALIGDREE